MIREEIKNITNIIVRESISNLKSIRFLIIVILLFLTILGSVYGITMLPSLQPQKDKYNIVCVQINADGSYNDILVSVYDRGGNIIKNPRLMVDEYPYDRCLIDNGTFIVTNLNFGLHFVRVESTISSVYVSPKLNENLFIHIFNVSFDEDEYNDDFVILITLNGTPVSDSRIFLDGKFLGTSDRFGRFLLKNLPYGNHSLDIEYRDYKIRREILVSKEKRNDFLSSLIEKDPEMILYIMSEFISIMVPLCAVALAYDSIAKEKMQNSLDLLLCRPIRRESIIIGKFLGSFFLLGIPLVLAILLSSIMIDVASPESISFELVMKHLTASIALLAIYIFIELSFSSLVKTPSSALLAGIGMWLFFEIFYPLLILSVAIINNISISSEKFNALYEHLLLYNPSGAYTLTISDGKEYSIISLAVWIVVSFVSALYLFKKRTL